MGRTKQIVKNLKESGAPRKQLATKGAKVANKALAKAMGAKKDAGVKKPHRYRPGTVALREIRKLQKYSTEPLIAFAPFERLVRECVGECTYKELRVSEKAFQCMRVALEDHLHSILEDANFAAIWSNRITVKPKHLMLVNYMRNHPAGANPSAKS